jgi:hypothetical protein
LITLSSLRGSLLEVESIEVLPETRGLLLKLRVLADVSGTPVGLSLTLKTTYGEVNRLFSRTKSLLSQSG